MNDKRIKFAFSYKPNQKNWITIALSFLVFYVAEAILFWQGGFELGNPIMKLPFANPIIYPLGFWGLFGYSIYYFQRKGADTSNTNAPLKRFQKLQGAILTVGITTGILLLTSSVIHSSNNVTLGHTAMFYALFIMAVVIGGIDLNIGWLSAALLWFLTALLINNYPAGCNLLSPYKDEDIWLGIALTIGFILIGLLPYYVNEAELKEGI